jgi:hypothetical protein
MVSAVIAVDAVLQIGQLCLGGGIVVLGMVFVLTLVDAQQLLLIGGTLQKR